MKIFKNFLLGQIFRIESVKGKVTRDLISGNGLNYVAAKKTENGVAQRCNYQQAQMKNSISKGNCICFVQIGDGSAGYSTYQEHPFVGMTGKIACGYIDGILNETIALYLISVLDKNKAFFSHANSWTGERLYNTQICLPILTNNDGEPIIDTTYRFHNEGFIPDWNYMSERVRELEEERVRELEAYLIATGLNDYELTKEDKKILSLKSTSDEDGYLEDACGDEIRFSEFDISDIYTVQKVRNKLDKSNLKSDAKYPCFSSDTSNNGILGYTDNPEFHISDETKVYIIFGDHTRTFDVATTDFSVLDNVKVLKPVTNNIKALQYINTVWNKSIPNLGYARHWSVAKNKKLLLPSKPDGTPDFEYMEKYIRAMEKVVIADVVKYKDKLLQTTKEIIS